MSGQKIVIALMCAALYVAVGQPAFAQRAGLGSRAGAVRYAARMIAANNDDNEPWNAGFGGGGAPAGGPREIAPANQGSTFSPRGVSSSSGRVNYGSIQNAGGESASTGDSGGNPVWDLVRMSNYLEKQEQITLHMTVTTERLTDSGQKVQVSSRQVTYVQRPDRLAVEVSTDKSQTRIVYDGTGAMVLDKTRNMYGTIAVQGTLDTVLDTLARQYGMAVPADDLLYKGAYNRIKDKIKWVDDLGQETVDGVLCSHIAFAGEKVDFQMWVQSREQPMPRRVLIIYKSMPGQPRCRIEIARCDVEPIATSVFKADVPAGAQQIQILPR